MEDITYQLEHYRETARHLWNTGYRALYTSFDEWDVYDEYEAVIAQLFRVFILQPLGRSDCVEQPDFEMPTEPFPFLCVEPAGVGSDIFINRRDSGSWDDKVKYINEGEAELRLIDYFDFDKLGTRDFEYYQVRITRFDNHPELVGRNALVRVRDAKVLHNPEIESVS